MSWPAGVYFIDPFWCSVVMVSTDQGGLWTGFLLLLVKTVQTLFCCLQPLESHALYVFVLQPMDLALTWLVLPEVWACSEDSEPSLMSEIMREFTYLDTLISQTPQLSNMNDSGHYSSVVITAVASTTLKITMVIQKKSLFASKQRQKGEWVAVWSFWIGFFACMVDWLTAAQ